MNKKNIFFSIAILCFSFLNSTAQQTKAPHLIATYRISGDGGWDYLTIQPNSNKLFVSHGTEVNIIDKNNGDSLGCIKGLNGVHGIAYVPELNKGYITSGRDNAVVVIDLTTNAVIKKINGGLNPDGIVYDKEIKKLIVSNGKSNDLSLIDPATDEVSATIPLNGKPEVALSDGKNIYVNLEDKNEVAVVDINSKQVTNRWSLKPYEAPSGMALDTENHLLFTACSDSKKLVVLDYTNGKKITDLPIGEDCDGLWFDKEKKMIYASNRDGTITAIEQASSTIYKVITNIASKFGAKTIIGDDVTHKIYVSTAGLKKVENQERPQIVPGTFSVMVFGY